MGAQPSKNLAVFDNPEPDRPYLITLDCPEFTCVCPMSGQPDFAHLVIRYAPAQHCIELRSLKLYLWSYRQEGAFHEAVTNRVCDDLVKALRPRFIRVEGRFNTRGGISTVVSVQHGRLPDELV